jgi:hypothetical protein
MQEVYRLARRAPSKMWYNNPCSTTDIVVVDADFSVLFCAAMVELVDTLDSKSGALHGRAGSSPARGTKEN